MILINYHLLAILPTILFTLGVTVHFISQNSVAVTLDEESKTKLDEQFLFVFNLESIVMAVINGIIMGEMSGSYGTGMGFLLGGLGLGIFTMSLLRSGYDDAAEYLMFILMMLFFYEFIYFLAAGTYFIIFGSVILGWQIAVIWYFGIITAVIAGFILYLFIMRKLNPDEYGPDS